MLSRILFWLSQDPVKRSLYLAVPGIHLALLLAIGLGPASITKPSTKKLVIRTISAPASTSSVRSKTTPGPKAKTAQPKQIAASPKPKAAPKALEKSQKPKEKLPASKPKPMLIPSPAPEKKMTNPQGIQIKKQKSAREEQLKELEERIAKIEAKNDRIAKKSELFVPSTLVLHSSAPLPAPAQIAAAEESSSEEDFASSLVGYLQTFLHLPELGEVQIQLTLRKDGKVDNIKIMRSESEKNRKYLEIEIPKLSFPSMYTEAAGSRPLLLTFCNQL